MALGRSDLTAVLKELYPDGFDNDVLMKNHPGLGLLDTEDKFGGRAWVLPQQRRKPNGLGSSIANAQLNDQGSKFSAFSVTPVSEYMVGTIDGIVLRAGNRTAAESAIDTIKNELESARSALVDKIAKSVYQAGASRGQVHPTVAISGTTLTLAFPSMARFFFEGMVVQASATPAGGSLLNGGSTVTLQSVNEDTGVLVATTNWSTITGIGANSYLFHQGDYGTGAAGYSAWCPLTTPSATLFFGVDRSQSPNLLGGNRVDTTNESIETFLIRTGARCSTAGFKPDYYIMHPYDVMRLEKAKENQRMDVKGSGKYSIGFTGFSAYGTTIVEDPDCPEGVFYGAANGAFKWLKNGAEQPVLATQDGEWARAATADAYEYRFICDYNFGAFVPSKIVTGQVPTI
jgi:hypothetical protein